MNKYDIKEKSIENLRKKTIKLGALLSTGVVIGCFSGCSDNSNHPTKDEVSEQLANYRIMIAKDEYDKAYEPLYFNYNSENKCVISVNLSADEIDELNGSEIMITSEDTGKSMTFKINDASSERYIYTSEGTYTFRVVGNASGYVCDEEKTVSVDNDIFYANVYLYMDKSKQLSNK